MKEYEKKIVVSVYSYCKQPVSKIRGKEITTWENREEKSKKRSVSDRFSSLTLAFSFAVSKKHGFFSSYAGEKGELPFHLPSHDSSQFFFELFVSNFTSPPCHAMSFFFFLVYPSAIRGVDELALRVLPPYLLYHPHSSLCSPLSIPSSLSFFFSLFVSSPFSSISRPSSRLSHRPSPSFFLSLGRFIASSTTLRSPPSTSLPAFSLFRRARWFHLLIPSPPPHA